MFKLIWGLSAVLLAVVYADSIRLTRPRSGGSYLVVRTRARIALAIVELLLAGAAIAFIRFRIMLSPGFAIPAVGALLTLAGTGLAAWAKIRLGQLFTVNLGVKEGHRLVTDGPYAIVRHPIYLGIVLFCLGSGLVWNRVSPIPLAIAYLICFHVQSTVEERLFAGRFAAAYDSYRARVPGLLPWPRPRGENR